MSAILDFSNALHNGLRPYDIADRNRMQMQAYQNLRCSEFGARAHYTIHDPFAVTPTTAWHHPQILLGKQYALLMYPNGMETIGLDGAEGWTRTAVTTYDWEDDAKPKNIVAGGTWHMMDFWSTVLLFNGACIVIKTPANPKWFVITKVTVKTGCDFRDARPFMGGFNSSDIYSLVSWPTMMQTLDTNAPEEIQTMISAATTGADRNWVWFGSPGGGDLFFLFDEVFMKYGSRETEPGMGYTDSNPYYMDYFQRTQMGFMIMPWNGIVKRMKPLGSSVVVYGGIATNGASGGVTACVNYEQGVVGLRDFTGMPTTLGIYSAGAVAGDDTGHVFLGDNGELWAVGPNFQAQRLGYKEFFGSWLEYETYTEVIAVYDPEHQQYYFSNGDMCYVLGKSGLSRAPWLPLSLAFHQGGLVGTTIPPEDPDTVILRSDAFDTGDPGTVFMVQGARIRCKDEQAAQWKLYLEYRASADSGFERLGPYSPDAAGQVLLKVTGIEFIWELRHADASVATLDGIAIEVDGGRTPSLGHRVTKVVEFVEGLA